MKIQAIGGCCKNSTRNYENAVEAAKRLNISEEVEHVSDVDTIINMGVLATPGLAVNGKVVSYGRVLSVEQAMDMIQKYGKE